MATKTFHGSELYDIWIKNGGTNDSWKIIAIPILRDAGTGPLYRMTDVTLGQFKELARLSTKQL